MEFRRDFPDLGLGLGLRSVHFDAILAGRCRAEWFEVLSENFLRTQGRPRRVLDRIAERYPVVLHGVALSIGSTDPLDFDYLAGLKRLATEVSARWVSDHLCWTGVGGQQTHDLLPLPRNADSLRHVVDRIRQVQDFLERPLILENPSAYLRFRDSTWTEAEFLGRVAQEANCGLLLDVNNLHVSCTNLGEDPVASLEAIPAERVVQIHLAGHTDCGTHLLDTHDRPVADPVWELYDRAHRRLGAVSTLLEWDSSIPGLPALEAELDRAAQIRQGQATVAAPPVHSAEAGDAENAPPHPLSLVEAELR